MIELHFDAALIEEQMKRLEKVPYAVQRALYPAVAEVMSLAKDELSQKLAADVSLPAKLIRQSVKSLTPRINGNGVEGYVRVASKAVPLIEYDVEPKEVTARKGLRNKQWPGFSYSLRSGARRRREELEGLEHMKGLPFIASMHNRGRGGHLGIYRRTAFGQTKELYGPYVQYHATTPEMEAALISSAEGNFLRILPRVVDQVLAGASS